MSRSNKYVIAGPGVFGVDRPHPLITTKSCTNGVLNASVFHGGAVYHFAEGHERILPARTKPPIGEGGERRALGRDGNRAQGTPEQNKAVVQGSIAFYGTYIQETDRSPRTERRLLENNVPPCLMLSNDVPVGNEGQ
jgi:hypothetical protein